ncbi:MAG TPA: hypothetical protein VHG28_15025 [Longimicrobiaceae bacterium]|nr:hypothetical protein [Longimicrobiaceae bacterium]
MYLVMGASGDPSALWAYRGLRERRVGPLEWVSLEALAGAGRWEHRVGADGAAVRVTLADGREIRSEGVRGAINRLWAAPGIAPGAVHPADREYAEQELAAFYLSWLHALPPPVLNRPTPRGLCGAWRHATEWRRLAARAGLPTPEHGGEGRDAGPVRTVYAVAGEVVGDDLPRGIREGCRRLARLAGTALLGISLAPGTAAGWAFAGATPLPDLRPGGDALLDALARALLRRGGGRPG